MTARVLISADAVGGVWQYALDLAAGMAARGIEPVLAVLGPQPSAAQLAEASGLEVIATGLPLDWTAESPAELARARNGLRALVAGAASAHLHAPALADDNWPVPVVAVAHSCVGTWWRQVRGGPMPEDFRWRTEAAAAGLRAADAVIAPTAAHAAAVQAVYGEMTVAVVHNGRRPAKRPDIVRDRAVLTAGRLWDEGKNVAALDLAAAGLGATVRAAGPVAGPNGAEVALPHLELLGTLDAAGMARAYAGARVFASMARYEPFGLAVLEAAQAGLRLVLSDIPSFRELWDGVATFVADAADLCPALLAALAAEGDGGAGERASRYTVAAMVEATLAVHRAAGAAL